MVANPRFGVEDLVLLERIVEVMREKSTAHQGPHVNPWAIPLLVTALAAAVWLAFKIDSPGLAVLATVNALACGAGIIRSIVNGLRPVATVFFTFSFAWLGVAPIIQISESTVAWGDGAALYDPMRVATALALNLAGTVAFFAGVEFTRARYNKRRSVHPYPMPAGRIRPWVLFAVIVLGIALMPIAIQANGGLASLFLTRAELSAQRAELGNSYDEIGGPAHALTVLLPGSLAIAGALLCIYAIQGRWTSFMQIRVAHFVGLCVACVSLVLFSNPIANSRFTAAAAFGTLFLAWIRPRSARWGYLFAGFMLIATLLIYPLANVFRSQTFNVWTGTEAFTSPDFDGFQQVINTLDYVSDYGHTWGIHIFSGIGFFVPRSIWAAKAEPASEAIAENAGYVFTNLSLPIHAEFYLEFGWLGLLAGMAVLGIVAGRLDGAWLKAPGTKAAMVAPYVAFAMLGVIRGPIGGATPVWGAVVVLLMLGITSREKTSSPELFEAAERSTALK